MRSPWSPSSQVGSTGIKGVWLGRAGQPTAREGTNSVHGVRVKTPPPKSLPAPASDHASLLAWTTPAPSPTPANLRGHSPPWPAGPAPGIRGLASQLLTVPPFPVAHAETGPISGWSPRGQWSMVRYSLGPPSPVPFSFPAPAQIPTAVVIPVLDYPSAEP